MADPHVVVNASPLIVLSRAGRIDLLTLVGTPVHVPESVSAEVRAHSDEAAKPADSAAGAPLVSGGSCGRFRSTKVYLKSAGLWRQAELSAGLQIEP